MNTNSVGQRAFRIALLVSLASTILSMSILFLTEYQRKSNAVSHEIQMLREVQLSGIEKGLWDFDSKLLQALLDGLRFYPYINYVKVESREGLIIQSGTPKEGSAQMTYPLKHRDSDTVEATLGNLVLEVDSRQVLIDVLWQVFFSLAFQVVFFVVQALIVLLLFSGMVTRHLSRIASYIRDLGVELAGPPLVLEKKPRGDELDVLVDAFNGMRANLFTSREAELKAMEDLRISEAQNRVLVDEAPDAIMMFDVDAGSFISCNHRAETMFGRPREALLGITPAELYAVDQPDGLPVDQSVAHNVAKALSGESVMLRRRIRNPAGGVVSCEVHLTRLPSPGHPLIRVSFLDITERIRAEEAVQQSLREKEVLLQEVYHRTKNNMQLIAAFLNMEALSCGDEKMESILTDMIARINSMSLVHQKLYQSKDLSRIDFGDYLRDLVTEIRDAYKPQSRGIEITLDAPSGIVSLFDTAIPCGLVLNELIINALKHAFPEGRQGSIHIGLSRHEVGTLTFSVTDDGVGLPVDFDFRRDGKIGLQTVSSLVEIQLHGSIFLESGAGTRWVLTIRDDIYGVRV